MGDSISKTLVSSMTTPVGTTQDGLAVMTFRKTSHPHSIEMAQGWEETNINDTLNVFDNGETRTPTLITQVKNMKKVYDWHRQDTRMTELGDVCVTAAAGWGGGGNNMPYVLEDDMETVVRRLTPLECERLQGFPEVDGKGWTDIGEWVDSKGKLHKNADSPRYKALGNSIGLPFWAWLAERIVKQLKEDGAEETSMASLFDGIGGFPLVFSRAGCKPVWASEIEEFPIAVTKIRFPEEEDDKGMDKHTQEDTEMLDME